MAYCSEMETLRQVEEDKLRHIAEHKEQKKRVRAEVERLRANITCVGTMKQTLPDQLLIFQAESKQLKLELKSSYFSFRMLKDG